MSITTMYTAWIDKGLALSSQFSYYRMEGHEQLFCHKIQSLPYRQRALHIATCNLVHKTLLTSIISMCRSNYTFIVCESMLCGNIYMYIPTKFAVLYGFLVRLRVLNLKEKENNSAHHSPIHVRWGAWGPCIYT